MPLECINSISSSSCPCSEFHKETIFFFILVQTLGRLKTERRVKIKRHWPGFDGVALAISPIYKVSTQYLKLGKCAFFFLFVTVASDIIQANDRRYCKKITFTWTGRQTLTSHVAYGLVIGPINISNWEKGKFVIWRCCPRYLPHKFRLMFQVEKMLVPNFQFVLNFHSGEHIIVNVIAIS